MAVRNDGLWGKVKWSKSGEEAVSNGEYKFISPVWKRSACEALGNQRVRPLELDSAAITNCPNIKDLKPMAK